MQPDAQPPVVRINDTDRERAAALLERACGEARLTLEEFSVRVGAVWAADTAAELAHATEGLAVAPPVGVSPTLENVVNVFSSSKRRGKWRLPSSLRITNVFGEYELDLREAAISSDAMSEQVVVVHGRNVFGTVKVIVPEGVEVDLGGSCVFGDRTLHLAPVQRLAGTPLIRVRINTVFGEIKVLSRGPNSGSAMERWARELFS